MKLEINGKSVDLSISGLQQHYRNGDFSPSQLFEQLQHHADQYSDNPIWIYRLTAKQIQSHIERLTTLAPEKHPLWGIPFAIKDNIDLAGIPTTAACSTFSYTPEKSATVVQRLLDAGAIPLGKTNMDQFATGLVGTRSPWGACHNAFAANIISGGSSSGSAIAVALGLASFALGTDTAGSGRVPASLNNLVGLKPSRGLLSTHGVVPACRSLDCVSIFALDSDDANCVFDVAAHYDEKDCYARINTFANGKRYYQAAPQVPVIGVPSPSQLEFFGNTEAATLFNNTCEQLRAQGIALQEIDFTPFKEAAKLLYQGPWVAERWLATEALIESHPESLLPVIREIIGNGNKAGATEAFAAQYQLQAYKQLADRQLQQIDAILTPTNGSHYTIAAVNADPIKLNSQLGYYTNFMNLLDYAAVALPAGFYRCGVGFGVTLFHHALRDKQLLALSARMQNILQIAPGAAAAGFKLQGQTSTAPAYDTVDIVVCGAHLSGQPLNWQLKERGAVWRETTTTSPDYRFYALPGGPNLRPGLVRSQNSGHIIEVEVWRMPVAAFGSFVHEIPSPLGIGKVELHDGRWCTGFICDQWGLEGAEDITHHGGWRNFLRQCIN